MHYQHTVLEQYQRFATKKGAERFLNKILLTFFLLHSSRHSFPFISVSTLHTKFLYCFVDKRPALFRVHSDRIRHCAENAGFSIYSFIMPRCRQHGCPPKNAATSCEEVVLDPARCGCQSDSQTSQTLLSLKCL